VHNVIFTVSFFLLQYTVDCGNTLKTMEEQVPYMGSTQKITKCRYILEHLADPSNLGVVPAPYPFKGVYFILYKPSGFS
jgi:hypothetical protein